VKAEGTHTEEKTFNASLSGFIEQCSAFLHYLKAGSEDYG